MKLKTAIKYSRIFMYKGEKYVTGAVPRGPTKKAYDIPVMKYHGAPAVIYLSSACNVKPVVRIPAVIAG